MNLREILAVIEPHFSQVSGSMVSTIRGVCSRETGCFFPMRKRRAWDPPQSPK